MTRREPEAGGTTVGRINKHGAYICGPCTSGNHLGVHHGGSQYALCQCTCDGVHDKRGRIPNPTPVQDHR